MTTDLVHHPTEQVKGAESQYGVEQAAQVEVMMMMMGQQHLLGMMMMILQIQLSFLFRLSFFSSWTVEGKPGASGSK